MGERRDYIKRIRSTAAIALIAVLLVSMIPISAISSATAFAAGGATTFLTPDYVNGAFARKSSGEVEAGIVGTVSAGGREGGVGQSGYDYDLVRMYYGFETQERAALLYYSDGLFYEDPVLYNEHLANVSWALASAGGYLDKNESPAAYGNVSYNKHAAARQFLADIGCPDEKIYINSDNFTTPTSKTIGVTIGSKELTKADGTKTGDILVPVTVRGLGYEMEWASNVTLGKDGEASGFSQVAQTVERTVFNYLDDYGLMDEYQAGKVKFWLTGFSRAGATANLASKRIIERIDADGCGSQVFSYPCEAPKGGTDDAEQLEPRAYFCIHNLINKVDVVPYVAPEQMGFKRYGVDHFIPGTDAYSAYSFVDKDGVIPNDWDVSADSYLPTVGNNYIHKTKRTVVRTGSGPKTVTTYCDNIYIATKTDSYNAQREKMLAHLAALDPDFKFDDSFQPWTLDVFRKMNKHPQGYADGRNHVEIFVEDFMNFVQVGTRPSDFIDPWYQAVSDRGFYVNGGIESMARMLMEMEYSEGLDFVFNMDSFDLPVVSINDVFTFLGGETSMYSIWERCVSGWMANSEATKQEWYAKTWDMAQKGGVFDKMSPGQVAKLSSIWNLLVDRALTLVTNDYHFSPYGETLGFTAESPGFVGYHWSNKTPTNPKEDNLHWAAGSEGDTMMYIQTFAQHAGYIISCHLPQVNIAWTRSYDSWYDDTTRFVLQRPAKVPAVKAFATSTKTGEKVELVAGADAENKLSGEQLITFELDSDDPLYGEAVYYYYADDPSDAPNLNLYRDGITLMTGSDKSSWSLKAFDISYGVRSPENTFNITIYRDAHDINVVRRSSPSEQYSIDGTKEGEKVTIAVPDALADTSFFSDFSAEVWVPGEGKVRDVTEEELGVKYDTDGKRLTFTMPAADGEDFPYGYALLIYVDYSEAIQAATVNIAQPVAGEPLQEYADVTFDNGVTAQYPIEWTYLDAEHAVLEHASGEAYQDTEYFAKVDMNKDAERGIVFAEHVHTTLTGGGTFDIAGADPGQTTADLERFNWDGSVFFSAKFEKTGTESGRARPSTLFKLTIIPLDLNTDMADADAATIRLVEQGQKITVTAPAIEGKRFSYWETGDIVDPRIEIPEDMKYEETATLTIPDNLQIDQTFRLFACYTPVVDKFEVRIEAPVAGERVVASPERVRITVAKQVYEVDPACICMNWIPEVDSSGLAEYLTKYTAEVWLEPESEEGFIKVKLVENADGTPAEGAESDDYNINFKDILLYADGLRVVCDTGSAEGDARILSTTYDADAHTAFVTFSANNYELAGIWEPEDIGDVNHGATGGEISALLPKTTSIRTKNGLPLEVEIEWDAPERGSFNDEREAITWTATGRVKLPDTVDNPDEIDLGVSINVYVNEAPHAMMPLASLQSGMYTGDRTVTLSSSEANGTTYYTIDGTEPTEKSPVYNGGKITVSKDSPYLVDEMEPEMKIDEVTGLPTPTGRLIPTGRKMVVVKAFTTAAGKWDSSVVTYEYVIDDSEPDDEDDDEVNPKDDEEVTPEDDEKVAPDDDEKGNPGDSKSSSKPGTGDDNSIVLWAIAVGLCALGIRTISRKRKEDDA